MTDVRALIRLHACMAQFRYASRAGYDDAYSARSAHHYHEAIRAKHDLRGIDLIAALKNLHSVVSGATASDFRSCGMYVQSKQGGQEKHDIAVDPNSIDSTLRRIDVMFFRNEGLHYSERVFLTMYGVLKVHPFPDGNGRAARALCAAMLAQHTGALLDLTAAIDGTMAVFNGLLAGPSKGAFAAWMEYMRGLLKAETHYVARVEAAYATLTPSECGAARAFCGRLFGSVQAAALQGGGTGMLSREAIAAEMQHQPARVRALVAAVV